ncbi:GDSL esterase/lipase EXL3 [Elaeis guineensis]|uniref:GDSL esterase/lipase EXL3 n=1 Tax=Elaeis guineensis var. tenera TaxID=51953 RepID=A0A6I9R3Y9_ELAGV|nr:GDSL esterase/lipase EXL3 [Elaeis guineensis]
MGSLFSPIPSANKAVPGSAASRRDKREKMQLTSSRASHLALPILIHLSQLLLTLSQSTNQTTPLVPAVIVFGDSIVDPGNNNAIKTVVKCNFPPYGVDFIGHKPTGRFSNGKIPTDFIASKLGVKELLPAYLGTTLGPEDLLTGVSFASGGTGFDPLTSRVASVLSMAEQLELFQEYKEKVRAIAGAKRADEILSKALYLVCAGSDDIANTYFTTPFRRTHYDISSYSNLLLHSASNFLQELIHLGARKIGVAGIPPIGCVPSQRTLSGGILRHCAPGHNQMAELFNSGLTKEIRRLGDKHRVKVVYIDIYTILLDMIQRPNNYGFEVSTKGCCGTGDLEVSVLCNGLTSTICTDVSQYVFWDSYHPTERAYKVLVDWLYQNYISYLV